MSYSVIYIEDQMSKIAKKNMTKGFESRGHSIDTFFLPELALKKMKHSHYDIAIVDRSLVGNIDGDELMREIKSKKWANFVVAYSNYARDYYGEKPWNMYIRRLSVRVRDVPPLILRNFENSLFLS